MKNIILTLLLPCITGCIFFEKSIYPIKSIELCMNFQNLGINGEIINSKSIISIYVANGYIVYKAPHYYVLEKAKRGKKGEYIYDKTLIDTIKYEYYIYNQNKQIGYRFDSINVLHPVKISIDSFQRVKTLKGSSFYSKEDNLLSSEKNIGKTQLIEKRVPKQWDEDYADSSYFYYSNKFKDAPYVFSKTLDSTTHLKLYKISYIYCKRPKGKQPFEIPRREYTFELKEAKPAPEIPGLIRRFKAMELKLN